MKKCSRCKTEKPETEFTKSRHQKDGLNHRCKVCTRAACKAFDTANPEKAKARSRRSYLKNKERVKENNKAWLAANPGKAAEYCKAWRERHPGAQAAADKKHYEKYRDKKLAQDRARRMANLEVFLQREHEQYIKHRDKKLVKNQKWRKQFPERAAFHAALRRTVIGQRTPKWLTQNQLAEIKAFFLVAKIKTSETGVSHHVDHIVPLRGKTVCGLNVPWNLQVLPAYENLRKNNRHAA